MKKAKLMGALLCSACLAVSGITPVMADSVSVVTLGADLSAEQKNTMMKYFKADSSQVQILTITNQDEREHLSAYVPIEQIGTRTVSCAYVKPTQSGGIKVRTANLNWVTGNMIATTLSTSGVKNCEVVAACPFEVSGTGALTGIQMAYETASGEKLDEAKKQIATEEMVVTGNLADEVGKNNATTVINKSKMEVIQNDVQNADEITNVVNNIAQQNNVALNQDQMDTIVGLLEEIAQQGYNYDDVKDTLEMVDENVSDEGSDLGNVDEEKDDTIEAGDSADGEDSIVTDLDESILGENVLASSTEDPELETQTGMDTDVSEEVWDTEIDTETEESVQETYDTDGEETPAEEIQIEESPVQENYDEGDVQTEDMTEEYYEEDGSIEADTADEQLDLSLLTEDQKTMFEKIQKFCAGEYKGDNEALQTALEDENAWTEVVLDEETGSKIADKVEKICYDIFVQGTDSYVVDGTEKYMSIELNMINKALQTFFGQDEMAQTDEVLTDVSEEGRVTLYTETMCFFEKMYDENTETVEGMEMDGENVEEIEVE